MPTVTLAVPVSRDHTGSFLQTINAAQNTIRDLQKANNDETSWLKTSRILAAPNDNPCFAATDARLRELQSATGDRMNPEQGDEELPLLSEFDRVGIEVQGAALVANFGYDAKRSAGRVVHGVRTDEVRYGLPRSRIFGGLTVKYNERIGQVDPHLRGENQRRTPQRALRNGGPPLTRGKLKLGEYAVKGVGWTPTYAGKTQPRLAVP